MEEGGAGFVVVGDGGSGLERKMKEEGRKRRKRKKKKKRKRKRRNILLLSWDILSLIRYPFYLHRVDNEIHLISFPQFES